jgi:hypothetical protein
LQSHLTIVIPKKCPQLFLRIIGGILACPLAVVEFLAGFQTEVSLDLFGAFLRLQNILKK